MSIQRINNLSTRIVANLQTRKLPLKSKQKGASALEYIVLAAVLVGLLTFALADDTIRTQVQTFFSNLFTDATTAGD
ncbi:Flp family type IVb pilin [Marinobacter sp. NP-4(2019)]|uniref:Flp family type IVb pilin n=1 Tax=Marinobacter sp. NP-4(2019) TaxID=2488665 RepID=UPI001D17F179|nr:hypothetical protein [Marinobacter sp. NP-4(2019)]